MERCDRCGAPHDPAKCQGHSKRTGKQCRRDPAEGATVCSMHGGAAPQVKRAAARRTMRMQAESEARRMMDVAGVDADPLEHLLDSLYQAAAMVAVYSQMVADLDAAGEVTAQGEPGLQRGWIRRVLTVDEAGEPTAKLDLDPLLAVGAQGGATVHPFLDELRWWAERRAKFAKLCLDAGVEERQIAAREQQVDLAVRALEAALDRADVDVEQRQQVRKMYAEELVGASSN